MMIRTFLQNMQIVEEFTSLVFDENRNHKPNRIWKKFCDMIHQIHIFDPQLIEQIAGKKELSLVNINENVISDPNWFIGLVSQKYFNNLYKLVKIACLFAMQKLKNNILDIKNFSHLSINQKIDHEFYLETIFQKPLPWSLSLDLNGSQCRFIPKKITVTKLHQFTNSSKFTKSKRSYFVLQTSENHFFYTSFTIDSSVSPNFFFQSSSFVIPKNIVLQKFYFSPKFELIGQNATTIHDGIDLDTMNLSLRYPLHVFPVSISFYFLEFSYLFLLFRSLQMNEFVCLQYYGKSFYLFFDQSELISRTYSSQVTEFDLHRKVLSTYQRFCFAL